MREELGHLDEFLLVQRLIRSSSSPTMSIRRERVQELLDDAGFLQNLRDEFKYWRGNLYVVQGRVSRVNKPVHWHWEPQKASHEPTLHTDRIRLPFLELDTPTAIPHEARLAIERRLLGPSDDFLTSFRTINLLQTSRREEGYIEIKRPEIMFYCSLAEGRTPLALADLHGLKNQDGLSIQVRDWWQKHRLESHLDWLREVFPFPEALDDPGNWRRAKDLLESNVSIRDSVPINTAEAGIMLAGMIVCFKAGDLVFDAERSSLESGLVSGYCLLELQAELTPPQVGRLMSAFSHIIEVGALSVALAEHWRQQYLEFMHSFADPLMAAQSILSVLPVGKSADGAKLRDYIELVFAQTSAAIGRGREVQPFDLAKEARRLKDYFGRQLVQDGAAVVVPNGDSPMPVTQSRNELLSALYNALSNACKYGECGANIWLDWGAGVSPSALLRRSPMASEIMPHLNEVSHLDDGNEVSIPANTSSDQLVNVIVVNRVSQSQGGHPFDRKPLGLSIIHEMAAHLKGRARCRGVGLYYVCLLQFPKDRLATQPHSNGDVV